MSDDPNLVAIEHVAWCLRHGITLSELHAALGPEAGPRWRSWEDAIPRLIRIASDMALYLEGRKDMVWRPAPPPFRRREPLPALAAKRRAAA